MSNRKSILVVEDEADLAEVICFNLKREGYLPQWAAAGDKALDEVKRQPPDLILLDRMLPELSGEEVAKQIRRDPATASIPIIMLTAKVEETDQLVGFALGADDYITKPFSMKVLMARIGVILRRGESTTDDQAIMREGPFYLDHDRHEVRVDDRPVSITATEFRLLASLMSAHGRVLDRSSLIDQVLGHGAVVLDRTMDVHITALRKKISVVNPQGNASAWIQTVRGVGYTFRPPANS